MGRILTNYASDRRLLYRINKERLKTHKTNNSNEKNEVFDQIKNYQKRKNKWLRNT